MQSTWCEMSGWMKHKLESRLPREISITSDRQMTPPLLAESEEELKSLLMKVKGEWKSCVKTQQSKNWNHGIWSHHFIANKGEEVEAVTDFIFWTPKSLQMVTAAMKLKRRWLLGRKALTNLDSILKSRDITSINKGLYSQSYGFSFGLVQNCCEA